MYHYLKHSSFLGKVSLGNGFVFPFSTLPPMLKLVVNGSLNSMESRRNYIKDYDKKIKLLPEDVSYRYDDNQFLNPSLLETESPYIKRTDDEMVELSNLKLEEDIERERRIEVDSQQPPFNQLFVGQPEPEKRFTTVETVKDETGSIWKNVERLMPKQTIGKLRPDSKLILSPGPVDEKLPYFVKRTRARLYPIYLAHVVVNRDHKHYWQNRWDHMFSKYNAHILDKLDDIKWENNEKTITITQVQQICGDLWQFERDAREFLKQKYNQEYILTSVNEVRGMVQFQGDFIKSMTEFFKQKGF